MKKLNLCPPVLLTLLALTQSLAAQTVHQFSRITALPDKTISLSLTGSVESIFAQYFDQYVIEASTNLIDWFPLVTLQQTNQPTEILTYHDKAAAQFPQRYYRTLTNQLITPLPQPTGPYAVGTFSRLLTVPWQANRQFMVTFWYPAIAQAGLLPTPYMDRELPESGKIFPRYRDQVLKFLSHSLPNAPIATNQLKYPIVLYSPSGGAHRRDSPDKTEELASQGYIVVGLDHRDTFLSVFPDGTVVSGERIKVNSDNLPIPTLQDRVQDEGLVLDELDRLNGTDPVLGGRLDLDKIGAFGWSLGGAAAAELCRTHLRCRAGANMDGFFLSPEVLQQGVTKPFMILRAGNADPASGTDDRKKVFERLEANAYWVKLTDTAHLSFGEPSLVLDPVVFQQSAGAPPPNQQTSGVRTSQIARANWSRSSTSI
ncbi:MAG: hypothetical protein HY735_06355 [Verrucomicrobia bacterium]|nr:hypothetical protein [Verrucomicrobiota bacterium]